MSDESKIEVGQVWEDPNCAPSVRRRIILGRNGNNWSVDYDGDGVASAHLSPGFIRERWRLVSPAPAKVDRSGCKAWCGGQYRDKGVPTRIDEGGLTLFSDLPANDLWLDTTQVWCSPACRDAKVPPMEAPEAKCPEPGCRISCAHDHGFEQKPVEQPKPEKAAEAKPACLFFGKSILHGGEIHRRYWRNMHKDVCSTSVCDLHYLGEIEPKGGGSDILHNAAIPERLPRPRMAHVAGMHDDDLSRGLPRPYMAAARCGQVLSSATSLAFAVAARDEHERHCPNCLGTDAVSKIWRRET